MKKYFERLIMKQIHFTIDIAVFYNELDFDNMTDDEITSVIEDNFSQISIPEVCIENFWFELTNNNQEKFISGEVHGSIMVEEEYLDDKERLNNYIHQHCDGYLYGDFYPDLSFSVDEVFI